MPVEGGPAPADEQPRAHVAESAVASAASDLPAPPEPPGDSTLAAPYADFYLLPLKKKLLPKYKRIAQLAGKLWRQHGALEYREFVADDLSAKWGTWPMGKVMKVKKGEVLIGAIVGYKSRKHRDATNLKIMQDPRMGEIMPEMIFDMKRMSVGGFKVLVDV